MKVKITSIANQGNHQQESVTLSVLQDCDLKHFVLSDSTFNADNRVSNTFRHAKWFYPHNVGRGDTVIVYTKLGIDGVSAAKPDGTKTHYFYWGSNAAIWNNAGDTAILFELADWQTMQARQ